MKKIAVIVIFSMILISCSTGYHSMRRNGGYSDIKLSDDTYLVTFSGNGYTSEDKVMSYALRRCAELTKEKGASVIFSADLIEKSTSRSTNFL